MAQTPLLAPEDWRRARLVDNPFRMTPDVTGALPSWADMAQPKESLTEVMQTTLTTSPSGIYLNWGPYGGGKTHAANYFTHPSITGTIAQEVGVPDPLALVVTFPRGSADVLGNLYRDIVDRINLRSIVSGLRNFVEYFESKAFERFERLTGSEDFAGVLEFLSKAIPNRGNPEYMAARRYLQGQPSQTDMRDLAVARKISGPGDMLSFLTAFLNILVSKDTSGRYLTFSEVFLWIDEVEDLITVSGREQIAFTRFLRELVDRVPNDLTLLLNYTLKTPQRAEDIGVLLGDALSSRQKTSIEFGEFSPKDAEVYVRDVLNDKRCRPTELASDLPDLVYPFARPALDYLFERLIQLTPRTINETCSILIERALIEIEGPGEIPPIDADFIVAHSDQLRQFREDAQGIKR